MVVLAKAIPRWKQEREEEAAAPRTEEQKARDGQTAKIWGCIALAIPVLLVLAYVVTR